MVRAGKYIRFSQVTEGFLGASLQFEKGIEKTVMWYLFSKITPSLFTLKEGSTSHLGLLPSGKKRETALLGARNRCALRLADHQRSSPDYAGWDRLSIACLWSEPCLRDETAGGNKQWGMLCSTTLLQLRSLPYARHG